MPGTKIENSSAATKAAIRAASGFLATTVTAEMFFAIADNSTLNSSAINSALLFLETIGGGRLEFNAAGTYLLDDYGVNPNVPANQHCIFVPANNIEIYISPASTLKLADGQQTDAGGAVDIITWSQDRTNIKIHGGGEITGNTAGQTGWTGGYAQNFNGNIIESHNGGDSNIVIGPIRLTDHWSNAVNLGRTSELNRLSNVTLDNVYTENVGEGQQVLNCDGISYISPRHVISNGMTAAGDAVEMSLCTNFSITDVRVEVTNGAGAGSGIDIFGSKHGVVNGFVIDGWDDAFGFQTTAGLVTVDDVIVTNGVISNLTGTNVFSEPDGRVEISNVVIKDCPLATPIQVNLDDTLPPLIFRNVTATGCLNVLVRGSRKLIWHGGGNMGSLSRGIVLNQAVTGQTRNIDFSDLDFTGSLNESIRIDDAGTTNIIIAGKLHNITSGTYSIAATANLDELHVSNMTPSVLSNNGGSVFLKPGLYEVLVRANTDIPELTVGSKNQQLVIRATGSFNVIDRTQVGGVNIYLAGAVDFAMTAGDRLVLEHDGTNWYEISRTVT